MNINPAQSIRGRAKLPGDKSISHRAALIGAIASGTTTIHNFSTAVDCATTLSCLEQLGVELTRNNNTVEIQGSAQLQKPTTTLDCGNSGSTIRILSGILARQGFSCELAGDSSLNSRPMNRIIKPLELMGAKFESNDGKPPLVIHGTQAIQAITYELPVASAQVKSAILFAGLGAQGRTQVKESSLSRDHTERLFNGFGVKVTTDEDLTVTIDGPAQLTGGEITVPGDASSAAYFVAAAMLLPDSELTIEGVGLNPTRAEFLSLLSSWGADISTEGVSDERNEPIGTVKVRSGINSESSSERRIDRPKIPSVIDELPLLAVVGSQLEGGLEIRDATELRHKESDRLKSTATNLRLMGAHVEEHPDGLTVAGPTKLHSASLDSFGDHRIAMAFTIAALIADGPTEIAGADCVNISFPEFFDLLDSVVVR
ncbi:MAG TPA: 3-phosphoshikimate 1-carboxyvinyltransferase [Pyrinomonadaceae bacterium]